MPHNSNDNSTVVSPPVQPTLPITAIKIGPRFRKDFGDLEGLASSIRRNGLLEPVVITPDHRLIGGQRRIEAAKLLGWEEVPVHVVPIEDILSGENAENFDRKALTPSEQVAIATAVYDLEQKRAKERQREGGQAGGKACGKLPQASRGKTRDRIAKAIGTSGRTLEKAMAVVEAAEANPELAPIVEEMDRTGRVDPAFQAVKVATAAEAATVEAVLEAPKDGSRRLLALEEGVGIYRCLYVDPPWKYEDATCQGAAAEQYGTMSLEDIAALSVGQLAHAEGCFLWMWATWPMLREGAPSKLLSAWGFEWKSEITWDKERLGLGRWIRKQTEVLILATKGKVYSWWKDQGVRDLIRVASGKHSEKPDQIRDLVARLSPGPRLELFARSCSPDFDRWGDEAPDDTEYQGELALAGEEVRA
jgi:N6-adenosine-specific RNA methylase IME4/ParB-like chromosome segregation protein Spo0J